MLMVYDGTAVGIHFMHQILQYMQTQYQSFFRGLLSFKCQLLLVLHFWNRANVCMCFFFSSLNKLHGMVWHGRKYLIHICIIRG